MNWFFLAITAALFIVIETILEKRTLTKERTLEFAAMFAFGNALVLAPMLLVADLSQINLSILVLIFVSSLPSAGASLFIFKTLKHNQLSEAAPILALLPLIVTLFAFILLGEKISILQLAGLFLMVGGMIFLESKNLKTSKGIFCKGREKYIFFIFLSLVLGGVSSILDRLILSDLKINPLTYIIFIQIFIALNYALFFYLRKDQVGELKNGIKKSWKVVLLISVLTVTHRYMYASAIQIAASIGLVVAVYRLSALFNVFAGGKFFAEENILKKIVAGVVILSGTIFLVWK